MDLDGDGHRDILSGSYSRMEQKMAGLFQVLYGNSDGTFRKAEVLKGTDGEPLIIPTKDEDQITDAICTRPFAVDWDGDGHMDLVVGNFSGTFYWFKGEGKGKFQPKPELIKRGNSPAAKETEKKDALGVGKLLDNLTVLRISGSHSDPFVVDFDGDGDLDLLSGSTSGGVQWAENIAGKGKPPVLKGFEFIIKPGRAVEYGQPLAEDELVGPTTATRIWVEDFNGDGKLDILIGDNVTLVSPAKGVTKEEMKEKLKEWNLTINKLSREMQAAQTAMAAKPKKKPKDDSAKEELTDEEKKKADEEQKKAEKELEERSTKAQQEFSKAYEKKSEFMKEDRTGFVWVYLQK